MSRHLAPDEQHRLVRQVAIARANRVPWKVIEHLYGRSKAQLHRYLAAAAGPNETKYLPNETHSALSDYGGA